MQGLIYMYTSPNDKRYVGQTIRLKQRMQQHIEQAYNPKSASYNCAFHRAIRKYGIENFKFEILEDHIEREKLDEREMYWIKTMHSFGENGYNLTIGGDGNKGRIWSEEQKKHMSEVKTGVSTGPCSEETKKKISAANKGHGRKQSEETKRKISEHNARAVCKRIMITTDGIYHNKEFYVGMTFESVKECADYFGVKLNTISNIKRGINNKTNHLTIVEVNTDS